MGKKILTILVIMLLGVSLAACGSGSPKPSTDDEQGDATVVTQPDEQSDEQPDEQSDEAVPEITEGNYRHHIGNCTFYTANDLNQWVNGNEFDFYGMLDYFGWTERNPYLSEDEFFVALWPNDGTHAEISFKLEDIGGHFGYSAFFVDVSSAAIFYVEFVPDSDRELVLPDGFTIPYTLCEMMLYTLENLDVYSSEEAVYLLQSMDEDLSGYLDVDARID